MAIPVTTKRDAEQQLAAYCERAALSVHDQVSFERAVDADPYAYFWT